jgi:cell fate (sporulation/competence/biofilm development) regulator YlbF (YheA/YmcA/DUF963 family)
LEIINNAKFEPSLSKVSDLINDSNACFEYKKLDDVSKEQFSQLQKIQQQLQDAKVTNYVDFDRITLNKDLTGIVEEINAKQQNTVVSFVGSIFCCAAAGLPIYINFKT